MNRKFVIVAIIVVALALLAACGGGDVDDETWPTIGQVIAREVIKVLPTSEPRMPHRGIICPDDHNDC